MQKKFLAICMMVSMIFGTIGQNPFASAGRTASAPIAAEAGPDAEIPFEEEFAGDPEEGMPGGAMDPEAGAGEEGAQKPVEENQKPVEEENPSEENQKPEEEQKPEEAKSLGTTITTSDGSTYEIEVTYPDDCGIPSEGTELLVSEIKPDEAGYDDYVAASMEQLGAEDERVLFARVFDITIADAKDHSIVYEPNGAVRVSIRLADTDLDACAKVDVLHITEQKTRGTKGGAKAAPARSFSVDTMKTSKDGDTVEFTTESFSVYVIVGHEGGDIEAPRVTVHFLNPITDPNQQGALVNGDYQYTTTPYSFYNTADNTQTTQIIKDAEFLELIANPPNRSDKFFYGWYVVGFVSESGDNITFRWTDSPKRLAFETPISVTDNGNGTFTMSWTSEGKNYSETADVDSSDYSAHIYVAPLFEDYCFVNFHELAYAVSASGSLLTRKLVILGSDGTESVLVSDIVAPSTDTIRRIFRGWQYRTNNTMISCQTIDNHNNPITKYIDVVETIDLYPYFQEGRWLYYNVGESGNGATYVPAQFELAEFNEEDGTASTGGTLTSLPITSRVGYDFGGWRVETGDPANPYLLVTDSNGQFLSNVDFEFYEDYPDSAGVIQPHGLAYTIKNGMLTLKYPLSSLTFYAQWNEKENCKYTVVIWQQKVTDAYGSTNKTYDYYSLDGSGLSAEISGLSGRTIDQLSGELSAYEALTSRDSTKDDFVGFKYARREMSDERVKGDGSTVVNIYYDRYSYELKFFFARKRLNNAGLETGNFFVSYLTGTFTRPNSLTWEAYCASTSGKNWGDAGTDQLSDIYTGDSTLIGSMNDSAGNYKYYYYIIRANYGSDVSSVWPAYESFPTVDVYTLVSWYVMEGSGNFSVAGQGDTVKGKISVIDKQILGLVEEENGNFLLASYRRPQNTPYDWTYNIYQEVLSGVDYTNTVTINGVTYYLADSFLARSGKNDLGNQPAPVYKGFQYIGKESGGNLVANFYFTRNSRTFTFDYYYPTETGMPAKEVIKTGIPYGTSLDIFNHATHPDDTEYAIWPSTDEIPNHFEFQGWFEDESGTVPFDFSATMPDADKIAYGKWEPVYYNICIDPAGGEINHINYEEETDGTYPTFYLTGLLTHDSTDPKWAAALDAVDGDLSWVNTLLATGDGHNTAHSTYFSAKYGGTIGEYTLNRLYAECDDSYEGTKYYYVNMQFDKTNSEWGLHADLRNALYLTEEQLEAYYMYCKAARAWHEASRPGYYDATIPATFDEFKDLYVKKNDNRFATYKAVQAGSYEFVGWYVKTGENTISDNPYNFTNQIEGSITLQGVWRRVGNYYIAYDTVYKLDDSTIVSGSIPSWTDPESAATGKYIDGAATTTVQQPTDVLVNGSPAGDDIIFRGWRIVKVTGYENGVAVYTPLSNTYYDPAVPFTINADYADENGCIHMQAIYQRKNASDRRPTVANLTLNANGGNLVDADGTNISVSDDDVVITGVTGWQYGEVVEDASEQEIVFGDMQSNAAVRLYKYAVAAGTLDAPYNDSKTFFKHHLGYLLIGFDEGSDYALETLTADDDLRTGEAYIPTFAADSVISVQRTDNVNLFAVWEPMVYVTFENLTTSSVTFVISSDVNTMSIVNEVTGIFSREKYIEASVTLAPGEKIKFVMPRGAEKNFTITGTNTSTSQLLTVTSTFQGNVTGQTTAGLYRSSGADFDLTDTLHTDATGVLVTFTGTDTVFYDLNDENAVWTDTTKTGSDYSTVLGSNTLLYVRDGSQGLIYAPVTLPTTAPQPTDPTCSGKVFVGWTADKAAAECDLTRYTLPGTSESSKINNLAVIKNNYLWDFNTETDEGMTLYAVWGETVEIRFYINTSNHAWNDTNSDYFEGPVSGGGNVCYYMVMLAKGEVVNMPSAPTWNIASDGNQFYRWATDANSQGSAKEVSEITNVYSVGTPVLDDLNLYTSWIKADHINVVISKTVENGDGSSLSSEQGNKEFTFTAVITTKTYTLSVSRNNSNNNPTYTRDWSEDTKTETRTISLKHGEEVDLLLYFRSTDSTGNINRGETKVAKVFYQSVVITEVSDPNYTVRVNGVEINSGTVTTMQTAPTNSGNDTNGYTYNTGNPRNYTLHSVAAHAKNANVLVAFTNTRTKTDVTVTKVVKPDDYLTGDEEFTFTATYADSAGTGVTPVAADGYTVNGDEVTFTLKNNESVVLRGVPIGGRVVITESAPGFTAESIVGTIAGNETSRTSDLAADGNTWFTFTDAPADGTGTITFTNIRDTYDVKVTNEVLPNPYGSTTKAFLYTATLWNGDTQVVFPSTITTSALMSLTNGRKDMQISLKDGEFYVIEGLPGGYKLVVTQTEDSDYVTESRKDSNDFAEVLTRKIDALSANAQIDFKNTLKTGYITISKSVHLDVGQTLPAGTKFSFSAKLLRTANDTDPVVISQVIENMAIAAGASVAGNVTVSENVIYFELEDGEEIEFSGLPVGYYLQVKESASGYAAYVNGTRQDSSTRQIAEDDNGNVHFTNKQTSVVLKIKKADANDGTAIQGAEFNLYRMANGAPSTLFTLTSDADGWLTATEAGSQIQLLDLEDGTYYLSETTPAAGYMQLSGTITIMIDSSQTNEIDRVTISGSTLVNIDTPITEGDPFIVTVGNEKATPAPTDYRDSKLPFMVLLLAGFVLLSGFFIIRKKKED